MTRKPILCLDFDGVIHGYQSGWKGASICPDPIVPGAVEFIAEALKEFRVAIFSSRSNPPTQSTPCKPVSLNWRRSASK